MADPYRRRTLAWLLYAAAYAVVPAIALIMPVLLGLLLGATAPPESWVILNAFMGTGFALLGVAAGAWIANRILSRPGRWLEGYSINELRVLHAWLLKGDPLGRKLGRTHCHTCNHVRGSSVICPECRSHRIDPTE